MRLWTLHPRYLDARGLVAAWREALLAQKVLRGATRGYVHHPQLARFRSHSRPVGAIAAFLAGIADEARRRGYRFDTGKIARGRAKRRMRETRGQLLYEWKHLRAKLRARDPRTYSRYRGVKVPEAHPLFRIVAGGINEWERIRR
jgi:Pyrimidine dimer DNA glycosylase